MSVTIGSISAALLGTYCNPVLLGCRLLQQINDTNPHLNCIGVSGHAHKHWGSDFAARAIFVRVLGLIMMALSILMTLYAAYNFRLRGEMLL